MKNLLGADRVPEPLHIAIVEPMGEGGLLHYAYQMGEALTRRGAIVTLVTAQDYELEPLPHSIKVEKFFRLWSRHDAIVAKQAEAAGLRKWLLSIFRRLRRISRGWMLVREWFRLTDYLLHERPDVVQFGKVNFLFEAAFLAYLNFKGLLLTDICHEFELREQSGNWLARLGSRIYPWTFRPFRMVFLHAEANRRDFLQGSGMPHERTCVIPMGNQELFLPGNSEPVDLAAVRKRYGIGAEEPVILFFGNLTYSKGLPELVEAFAQLSASSPARLLIAGYPTKFMDLEGLQARVRALSLGEQVIFDLRYIPMEEVPQLMALSRVAVFPYRNSSQSGSLQMAYSFGKAVIATRVGGLPEVVEQGKSGLLVDPGSIEQLSDAMRVFVDDPELASRMGAYALELSRTRFSWDGIAGVVLEQLHQIMPARGN